MTTTALPQTTSAISYAPLRLSFLGVLRSEWIKATSLRSVRWSILVSIGLGIAMSAVMGYALLQIIPEAELSDAATSVLMATTSFPASLLVLVFGVLGVFVFSSEYASGMILSSLVAVPNRGLLFAAKATVLTVISAVVATILMVAGLVVSVIFLPASAANILTTPVLTSLLGTIGYLVAVTLLAFAIAGMLRSTAGAITVVVIILFLAPTILLIMGQVTDWGWVSGVTNFLPTSLGEVAGQGIQPGGLAAVEGGLGYWQAVAGLAGWAILPMLVSVKLFFARDAK